MSWEPTPLIEAGRSTYVRTTRKVYRARKTTGGPRPAGAKDSAIDALLKRLVRDFDFSFVYSGDRSLARLAAEDFYNEVLLVARIEAQRQDVEDLGEGERFSVDDVLRRWRELYMSWDRSSMSFQAKLRSLVLGSRKETS